MEGTVSNGIVSGVRKIEGFKFIQITAPISPGSSGGPVFNKTGQVIGIATAYLDVGQNLNFAMPVNYLKSLKPSRIKLGSLPKLTPRAGDIEKDSAPVKAFDIHYNYGGLPGDVDFIIGNWTLSSIDFGIKNLSNYPIKNIKLFFVYKNPKGEVISYSVQEIKNTILPQLALQFSHSCYVKYFSKGMPDRKEGKVEIRILDYQIRPR